MQVCLGWFCIEEWANQANLDYFCERQKNSAKDADAFVIIGVGGSNNAARTVIKALETDRM